MHVDHRESDGVLPAPSFFLSFQSSRKFDKAHPTFSGFKRGGGGLALEPNDFDSGATYGRDSDL